MIETRGPTDFFCSRTIQTEVMKNNKSLVLKLNQRSYFKCQDFIQSSCEQLSWFEPSVCDVCLCFWREDHLSVWKLHEQQQARGSVRLPPAEFRSGEYKRVSTFLCNPSSILFLTGFSVHSPKLLDTKSTDRKQTLLHFIVSIIQEKYPEVRSFHAELHFLDKAALGELMSSDGVEVQQLQIEAARFLLLLLLQPQTFNHQSLLSFSLLSQNRELNAETAPV